MPQPDQLWRCRWVREQVAIRTQQRVAFTLRETAAGCQLPAQEIPQAMAGQRLQVSIPAPAKMGFCGKGCQAFTVDGHGSGSSFTRNKNGQAQPILTPGQ